MIKEINVTSIDPSPYQHRKHFPESKLTELAKSIDRDGLIEPIVIRKCGRRWELIAGERRLRAVRDYTSQKSIISRIVTATDLQARRMCAAENMQRQDLSDIERVEATIEMVDAELADTENYSTFGESPKERVKFLLGKLNADYCNKTEHYIHKFVYNVETIFSSLPRPVEWRAFYNHDLPLVTRIDEDVRDIAIANQLNKSQTKALAKVKESAPEVFNDLVGDSNGDGVVEVSGDETLRDMSAREIKSTIYRAELEQVDPKVAHNTGEEQWYTPEEYIEAARTVMGEIDLDPASSDVAQETVNAGAYFTAEDDGLAHPWFGNIWLNPPYTRGLIDNFMARLKDEYRIGNVASAVSLVNNCTDTAWFHECCGNAVCFPKGRVAFLNTSGEAVGKPIQGQMLIYWGDRVAKFCEVFSQFGICFERST